MGFSAPGNRRCVPDLLLLGVGAHSPKVNAIQCLKKVTTKIAKCCGNTTYGSFGNLVSEMKRHMVWRVMEDFGVLSDSYRFFCGYGD